MFVAFDGIVFDILFLDGWQLDADLSSDGVDFLRWHHTVDVTCVMNQDATAAYKFPPQTKSAQDWNRKQVQEYNSRLRTKAFQRSSSRMRSGQIAGENPKKGKYPSGDSKTPFDIIFGGSGTGQLTELKSGKVVSPPAPVPSKVNVPQNEGQWIRILSSVPFERNLASQTGSSYVTADGGTLDSGEASVSPSIAKTTFSVPGAAIGGIFGGIPGAIIGGFAGEDIAKAVEGWGRDIIFGPDTKEIAESWWAQTKKTLEDLGNELGIGPGDIFGRGRQPLTKLPFVEPPVKRRLNAPPDDVNNGQRNLGWTVPATFQELQARLNKPGRTLAIWLNSGPDGSPEYMLMSPYPGYTTDALSGPKCRVMHLPAIHGNVTGILKLRFETWVAPPPEISFGANLAGGESFDSKLVGFKPKTAGSKLTTPSTSATATINPAGIVVNRTNQSEIVQKTGIGGGGGVVGGGLGPAGIGGGGLGAGNAQGNQIKNEGIPFDGNNANLSGNKLVLLTPPILSNRWTMRQVPDQSTHLNTTIIEGTAHFRLDVLQKLRMSADQLRPFFMHPIPFGYVRMPPEVTVLSDGASVQYTIVDIQQMMNNPGGQRWGVHSVKAQQTMTYNSPLDYVRSPFSLSTVWDQLAGEIGNAGGAAGRIGSKFVI